MKIRAALILALVLAVVLLTPRSAGAQPTDKIWRLGILYFGSRQSYVATGRYNAFAQGMRDLGYIEGKNYLVEASFADGRAERLPSLAAALARMKVDVIVATGTPANRAAQQATTVIPIVMTVSADPVADGFAASLARPGGNMTGLSSSNAELSQKYFELLSVAVPKLLRVGVLLNSANPAHPGQLKAIQAAANQAGKVVVRVDGSTADEIERGFATMTRERVQAVIIPGDSFFVQQARQIAELALKQRLPLLFSTREVPDAGGFMSYGPDINDMFRRAATFVDRIFKGAKAGDLPIEQPTKFELVINLKTAKALGLTIPPALLLRADEVIQ